MFIICLTYYHYQLINHNDVLSLLEDDFRSGFPTTQGFEMSRESRAQADLKFTYVVSCQIYGQQKQRKAPEAADIALLLQRLFSNSFILSN